MRYPLIDGQGNYGSVDGDPAAAYRYTEARLSKIALELLADIDKECVDWAPNFDDSKVDEGTRFVIYLPVHREEAGAAKARKSDKAKKDELWGSGTVLLVEDEPMVRSVAERALTRHGYTVITADSGEDALEILAKNEPIDLLISDVVMPGMDGPTMVREARLSRPELKILFMSGYAEEQLRKSIDIENVNFLPKPYPPKALIQIVRACLDTEKENLTLANA